MKWIEIRKVGEYYIYNAEKLVGMFVREMDDSVCEIAFLLEGEDQNGRWHSVAIPLTCDTFDWLVDIGYTLGELESNKNIIVSEIEGNIMDVLRGYRDSFTIDTEDGLFRFFGGKGGAQ